ncbi:MAG: arylsulfatase [Bacteroidales bacterium]
MQKSITGISLLGLGIGLSSCAGPDTEQHQSQSPNIIYILADDLGYGELGCYGQTMIETPNIDRLAASGMIFTDHYSGSPVCAPARAILLTGLHSGKVQIRGNDEWGQRGDVWNYRAMIADSTLEGQRPLSAGTVTIGTLLQSAGYKTGVVGKWGLGAPHTEGVPNRQGFDYFFGYNCQRQAHTYYPVHLWENEWRVCLDNDTVAPHTILDVGDDPYDPNSYAPFELDEYAPDLMFDAITRFVENNKSNPFFLYWATPIPHVPLQAPREWVDYYVEKFGDEDPYLGARSYFPHRYPRAAYAAMISYLDHNVGVLVQQLKDLGLYDNTLIIFTSDNGPTFNGGTDSQWFDSGGPFRSEQGYGKAFLHEGGIRVPMIASWPEVIAPGTVSNHPSVFYDVMPTFADITGIDTPDFVSGTSFFPALKGEKQPPPEFLYWEFPASGGQMAVRVGNLKALRKNMHEGNLEWELYDLNSDPRELFNIAGKYPEVIERVEEIVAREHTVSSNERFRFGVLGE